jgi:threonine/homoserine/homoserine lactone efflux protein
MTDAIIKGITLGLLLAISVGPIVFTVIKQSISRGRAGGLSFIAGISFSDILLVVLSNLFTNLFDVISAHRKVLAVIASIFLIVVGVFYLFFKKPKLQEGGEIPLHIKANNFVTQFITGFIMNIFNPGIIVFWLTTATSFVTHTLNQRVVIFSIALFIALAADVAKVLLADKIRKRLTPKNIHRVEQINGVILIGFGLVIILMQR